MQPVQLSLLPEEHPAPLPTALSRLPDPDLAEAVRLLGRLIAAAHAGGQVNPDE